MEPVGFAAGCSGSISAGLGTWSGVKNKRLVGPQSRGASYKKPKKPVAVDGLVESSAGVSNVMNESSDGPNIRQLWASKVNSEVDSVSGISDLDNLENVVAEETSYAESDVSGLDDDMNDAMPRKTHTRTYVLNSKPPPLSFNVLSDDEDTLPLPSPKFYGSNRLPPIGSRAPEKRNFNSSKLFALDIELSAVPGKTNGDKLVSIKKIFYHVDGFGGASTSSKFPEIIRSSFISEISLNKAREMAIGKKILVNDNLRKMDVCSDWEVIVKEIPMNLFRLAVKSVFSKFGKIVSIKMQLVGFWQKTLVEFESSEVAILMRKDSVHVALAHWALLYTLSVGTNVHNLSSLMESYNGKTCFIGHNSNSYVRDKCAVICFGDKAFKLAAIDIVPVFKSVSLHWAGLSLASCTHYKQFGHVTVNCSLGEYSGVREKRVVSEQDRICLAEIYKKKSASIARLVLFDDKTWAQVAGGSLSCVIPFGLVGAGLHSGLVSSSITTDSPTVFYLNDWLAILKHFLELLTDCVSGILVRLESIDLVSVVIPSLSLLPAVSKTLTSNVDFDIIINTALVSSGIPSSVIHNAVVELSFSNFKVFTAKVGGLETKLIALEASVGSVLDKLNILCSGLGLSVPLGINNCVKQADIIHWHKNMNNLVSIVTETKLRGMIHPWIVNKFDGVRVFTSGLDSGHMSFGVAIIMDSSLAKHVCKISEIPGQLLSLKLLFGNKLSVSILGLYTGTSSVVQFSQASDINSLVAKAVNKTFFVILGGDFNEDESYKCASFRKCFDLGLVNSLSRSVFVKSSTWCNSCGIAKIIDYMLVSSSLVNAIMDHSVMGVEDFFDTDHKAVFVSVGLGGLLDPQLNSMYKQANKDRWKFDFRDAGEKEWNDFKNATLANGLMCSSDFAVSVESSDLDAMWDIVHQIITLSAVGTFKKKWFKDYDKVFTKGSSRFHKLKLLVSKLVKTSHLLSSERLDINGALVVKSLFLSDSNFNMICSALTKMRKSYPSAKLLESRHAEESHIRAAINRRMESFESDKGHTIRSVLECLFRKVVLDYLVVGDELILEPSLVKAKVDGIMEGWTRKHKVVPNISNNWSRQYKPLEHVFDDAFSGVMCPIGFNELFSVVSSLPEGKAAGLFGISNKLWKHCDKSILDMLLVLLNSCLICKLILSKILSDRISLACSTFNVLRGDNFLVLRGMTTQFPIFAIGSVIEDALEKNSYDSVGWEHLQNSLVRIKMYSRFIRFFGSIHNSRINRVMTDFGLTDEYKVHDGLDQGEVFSPLLWRIFYDPLLCKVKRQADGCAGVFSFFVVGAFVDNTIWVGSSRSTTQHILNVVSEFFDINDILINNDKTVAISINCNGMASFLLISGSPISVAKKGELHHYLGIYLSTEGLSKPSLAKAHFDVWFFFNLVLKKAVSDKQFSYLVVAVFFSIIGYRTQFSYISISVCRKWDTLVHKGLRSKSGLPCDFPNDVIHHLFLYGLKTFEQVQAESKLALVISFMNSVGILGCLFSHQLHDLQILCWRLLHPLQCLVHVKVNPLNNFLTGVVRIFSGCDLSLGGFLVSAFCWQGGTSMSFVFGELCYVKSVSSLQRYGIAFVDQLWNRNGAVFEWKTFKQWKWLDPRGSVSAWFELSIRFLEDVSSPFSREFGVISASLFNSNVGCLSIYTDGSLSNLRTVDMKAGAAVFFEDIDMGLGVGVSGLMSSTLTELMAIALALECVPFSCSVDLFSDSQAVLDACKLKMELVYPDFRNRCWIEHCHIVNIIRHKNLRVNWCKVKGHSGVIGNEWADKLARTAVLSGWHLPHFVNERYLRSDGTAISGNSRHFVWDVFWSVHCAHWEVSCGIGVVADSLCTDIDWFRSLLVWHSDSHMAAGFTSKWTAGFWTYFMKTLHHWLPVAMCKQLYNKHYSSVVCLFYSDVEVSNHAFFCSFDANSCAQLLDTYAAVWGVYSGLAHSFSGVSQLLSTCVSNISVSTALCKSFVFKDWFRESVSVFKNSRIASQNIVAFVHEFSLAFWEDIWLVRAKHRAFMEKNGLIPCDGSAPIPISGLSLGLSSGMTRLLGIAETIGVGFRFHKSCLFFSDIGGEVSVYISA
ncbi:hypothetical protein G9A89_002007 [Geosiphon pyriformis]|nr:hypothetical protein G9A89_002007 [Geosiphon pyriformis]